MATGRNADARHCDARGQRLPAPRVRRVERGERRLRAERRDETDDVVAPRRRLDALPEVGLAVKALRLREREDAPEDPAEAELPSFLLSGGVGCE